MAIYNSTEVLQCIVLPFFIGSAASTLKDGQIGFSTVYFFSQWPLNVLRKK